MISTNRSDNLDLVKSGFDAWNRGDIEAFADHAAEDVAWLEVSRRPEGGTSESLGRDRMRREAGQIRRIEAYRDADRALEVAGLGESEIAT